MRRGIDQQQHVLIAEKSVSTILPYRALDSTLKKLGLSTMEGLSKKKPRTEIEFNICHQQEFYKIWKYRESSFTETYLVGN